MSSGTPENFVENLVETQFTYRKFVLVIAWFWVQLTINLASGNKGAFKFCESFGREKFIFFSYRESILSLFAWRAMRLLFNLQLIAFSIRPKGISFEQSYCKRSQTIIVTSLLFSMSKNVKNFFFQRQKAKTFKTDLEKCYQCSVSIEISLDLKVYFSQVTYEINSLITILLSNQIPKISAQWWIRK